MTKENKLNELCIPKEFEHPVFFEESFTMQYKELPLEVETLKKHLFIYDILFLKNVPLPYVPWGKDDTLLDDIFNDWQNKREEIAALFRKRERKNAKKPMIESIGLFIEALFWCNSCAVVSLNHWKNEIEKLKIRPVNVVERVDLLFQHPDHYHAYIQLNEMFSELRKKYYKALLLKK